MALHSRRLGGRPAYDRYHRRLDLYARAAPIFRTFGYRQVTMKALAHGCGLSAPALYRYFPSKLAFALFPLSPQPDGYCGYNLGQAADAHNDPLRALRAAFDAGLEHIDLVVLAMALAIEARHDEPEVVSPYPLAGFETTLTDIMLRCVPALGARAADLAHTIMALVVTAGATNGELSPQAMRRRVAPAVRASLLEAGLDPARIDEVFSEAWLASGRADLDASSTGVNESLSSSQIRKLA